MQEENISFSVAKDIFYNPEMQFCRSFCSLAIGALAEIKVLDAFSASGIRGIRYTKENKNVKEIDFLEANDKAVPLIKKNLKSNKIKGKMLNELYEKYFVNEFLDYDFIEIDPFGTPVPYLWSTFYGQHKKKEFYLSVSATDVAVLCGPEAKACLKNYHAKSLNNQFTHENGARIIIKRIAETAHEFNFGVKPLFSMSDRHYMKLLLKIEQSAVKAGDNLEKFGYISYCNKCGWRAAGKRMQNNCKLCNEITDYAGPLWIGELHDKVFLEKMLKLNDKRNYDNKEEIDKKIRLMIEENKLPQGYYNVHELSKRFKLGGVPKLDKIIENIKKAGFNAAKTHFSNVSIKTNADISEIKKLIGSSA